MCGGILRMSEKTLNSVLPGVFIAQKKNGDIYYRSSITYRMKHISLGSYANESDAHAAYEEAKDFNQRVYDFLQK